MPSVSIRAILALALPLTFSLPSWGSGKPWTVDDILKLSDVSDVQISPDGRRAVFVVTEADDEENSFNTDLYLAAIPAPGGSMADPIRLTRSPKADHQPRWSPHGGLVAFLSAREVGKPETGSPDSKAEKVEQVWLLRADGGEPWNPGRVKGDVHDLAWSPDGKTLALLVQEPKSDERVKREKDKDDAVVVDREVRRDQVWLIDAASGAAAQVTRGEIHYTDLDWAPGGGQLALAGQPTPKVPDAFFSDIYTVDLAKAREALQEEVARKGRGGEKESEGKDPKEGSATPSEPLAVPGVVVTTKGADGEPRFSPDGASIVYVTQDGNEEWYTNSYVAIVPAVGGTPRVLTRSFDEEVENVQFAQDGKTIFFEGNRRLTRHLFRVPIAGDEAEPLTRGDELNRAITLSRDGRVAAFVRENAKEPPEVHAGEVAGAGTLASVRRVTSLNAWATEFETFVKEPYRWKGAGGMEIEGLLVKPPGSVGRRVPVLVIVHGGPAGVFNFNYSVRRGAYPVQLFAQKGFAVFMPNPRGSGGYGEAFRKANVRDWGDKDYEDIMAGVDALVAAGIADPDRLGIMGWSYGGFMTSRVITKTHRFRAASVGAGVTNTFSFTGVADIPPFMRSYFGAWPWEEPAVYTSHTALFHAKGVKTPTLIQHGEADARVPISQGWELYVALREQGVPVEFVTYPRQGHGIAEPKLLRDAMRRNVEWFTRWILGE